MASLNAALTVTALPDVDAELAMNRLAWDLDLELLGDVGLVHGATTIRAHVGQRCLVDFVSLFGRRRLAVRLSAVVLARLTSRLAGVRLRLALGKRAGLSLAGAEGLVELTMEPLVLGLQVVDPSLKGLAVGTPERFHAGIVRGSGTCSCAGVRRRTVQLELGALIKYLLEWLGLEDANVVDHDVHMNRRQHQSLRACRWSAVL